MEALKRSQREFTRTLPRLGGIRFRERLGRLGLFALECWRLRGDLIEVYKIMRGIDRVESQNLSSTGW